MLGTIRISDDLSDTRINTKHGVIRLVMGSNHPSEKYLPMVDSSFYLKITMCINHGWELDFFGSPEPKPSKKYLPALVLTSKRFYQSVLWGSKCIIT